MTISLRLVDSENQIRQNIYGAIAEELNSRLSSRSREISSKVRQLIPLWIKSQPEMLSLMSSSTLSLKGQFGIQEETTIIVNTIANAVTNSTTVSMRQYDNKLKKGGLELNVQPIDFSNLLSLSDGHTVYEGGDLHWLSWLLTRGDETIIVGYEYNPQTGLGRSKLGNMITGQSFRVPPQFSGTIKDNFITRALSGKEQELAITKIFQQVLGGI